MFAFTVTTISAFLVSCVSCLETNCTSVCSHPVIEEDSSSIDAIDLSSRLLGIGVFAIVVAYAGAHVYASKKRQKKHLTLRKSSFPVPHTIIEYACRPGKSITGLADKLPSYKESVASQQPHQQQVPPFVVRV